MPNLRIAATQALEALINARDTTDSDPLFVEFDVNITALRAALAQQDAQAVTLTLGEMLEQSGLRDYHTPSDVAFMVAAQKFAALAMLNAAPTPPAQSCWCQTCRPITINDMRMVLCPTCGNKRCPHANNHRNPCTGSNEPGQTGSAYPSTTPPAQRVELTDEEIERIYTEETGSFIDDSPWALKDFARAIIEAYERKNGKDAP